LTFFFLKITIEINILRRRKNEGKMYFLKFLPCGVSVMAQFFGMDTKST
jgi:hypothetical protein